jgi:hypothetical protein
MTVVYNVNKFNKYGPVWSITSITSTIEYSHKIAKLVNIAQKTMVYRNQITPVNGTPGGPPFRGLTNHTRNIVRISWDNILEMHWGWR